MKSFSGLIVFLLPVLVLLSCSHHQQPSLVAFSGATQGTYYRVTYYAIDTVLPKPELEQLLQEFDSSVSVYNPASLITAVNSGQTNVVVDSWFKESWNIAAEISEATDGLFDCTVGPLVEAWGFSFRERKPINDVLVDSLRNNVGFHKVQIINDTVKIPRGMHLDFNAVAQGVSVDIVARELESRGVQNYLVDIGGEVKAAGVKPGNNPWRVGVEKPADNAGYGEALQAVVRLHDNALATSGSYRKFYVKDGVKYSHTINPKTGYPVTHSLLSATVITRSCGYADAWATALMVAGPEKAKDIIRNTPHIEGLLIYADSTGAMDTWASEGFREVME